MSVKTRIRNLVLVCSLLIAGCVSFKTAYQRFVDMMDVYTSLKKTIAQMDFNPDYPRGRYMADYRNLTSREIDENGFLIFHYAMATLTGEYICHYHLVVDPSTNIVVGWGFDTELGDPKETCGVAG